MSPYLAVSLVSSTPLLLDGATALTATVATIFALLSMGIALGTSRRSSPSTGTIWLGTAVCIVTAVGLVPVPCSVLRWLGHPERAELARRALELLDSRESVRCSISVDPGGTARATATAAGCLAAMVTGTTVARTRGSSFVLGSVGFAAAIVAIVTYVHTTFGLSALYGVYVPETTSLPLHSPVMNANHLAGLMALALPCALALARRTERPGVRVLATLAAVACTAMGVAARSRGGAIAIIVALGISVTLLLRDRRRGARSRRIVQIAIGALTIPTLVLLMILEGDTLTTLFRHKAYKTPLVIEATRFALQQGPLGVGRGAFSAAYAVHTGPLGRATYPESLLAQWASEFGPLLGCIGLAAFAYSFWVVLSGGKAQTAQRLGVTGLGVLVAQNFGDYSLEMPGIALCASLVFGAVTARLHNVLVFPQILKPELTRLVPAATALALGCFTLPLAFNYDLTRQIAAVTREGTHGIRDSDAWRGLIDAHPMEPSVYLLAASQARSVDSPRTIAFINLARRAAPRWVGPHIEAYLYLRRHRRVSQSAGEIQMIASVDPNLGARVTCMLPPSDLSMERWAHAVPTLRAEEFVRELTRCMPRRSVAELARIVSHERANDVGLATAAVDLTLDTSGADAAEEELRFAVDRLGARQSFDAIAAQIAMARGQPAEALRTIDAARAARRDGETFDNVEAIAAAEVRDSGRMESALARIEARMLTQSDTAWLWRLRARCEVAMGRPDRALTALDTAYTAEPSADLLVEIARIASAESRPQRAARVLERLCREYPDSSECRPPSAHTTRP